MARRRKNEAKPNVKSPQKCVAVRKSSRQIAKKQQQEQKINGDVVQSSSNNSDDSKDSHDEIEEKLSNSKLISDVQKKLQKCRRSINCEETVISSESFKEEDRQNEIEIHSTQSKEEKYSKNVLLCLSNSNDESRNNNTSQEIWSEDVIEETIICEEMEVEEIVDDINSQDNSVVVEQVLVVNEPEFDNKNVVEFTVIQNEDGTESMLMTSEIENLTQQECKHENVSQNIEQGVQDLRMDDLDISAKNNLKNNQTKSTEFENNAIEEKEKEIRNFSSNNCNFDMSSETAFRFENKDEKVDIPSVNVASLLDNSSDESSYRVNLSNDFHFKEKYVENSQESEVFTDSSSVENSSEKLIVTKKMLLLKHDDKTSALDKMEQLKIHDQMNSISEEDSKKSSQIIIKDKETSIQKLDYSQFKNENINKILNHSHIEEHSQDSEVDRKQDIEYVKLSSGSENSSDTLLSANSYKFPDACTETKNIQNLNEADRKDEFRCRSESNDTSTESGSNNSGVRRSTRIRTIGLMKQRSRGRGLVTKPNLDSSRTAFQQDRDKTSSSNSPVTTELKDISDNLSETQSDKENSNCKMTPSIDSLIYLSANNTTSGYDSDSSKPVKVKSRWRRSSELEMGGTSSFSGARIDTSFKFSSGVISGAGSMLNEAKTETDEDTLTTDALVKVENTGIVSPSNIESIRSSESYETRSNTTSPITTEIPKTIGAKISLPMVLEVKDREMEERLSQFENLKENLYLTERFTNKEHKRMVCDCFLTEEEIERGELGCGEDCLNRLLLIECGSRCVVGSRCTNKRFQNCDYAKCEVFRTEKKGFGLRATADLEAGEFIMEYVGEVVDPKDFRKRTKEYSKDKNRHHYFMALKSDQVIDATMKGNISRFINHSCDPNSETQKWTVNGELRIGFFNKKFIANGEEITFDYHFQRYGKEAQKCFCEALNCRGWIGETPEEEKEKTEKKEKREKDVTRKKKEEKKPIDFMEDEDLEEEIDKLCSGGLKNRNHTLNLSRLMVRSRELEHRTRLLRVIQNGEQPCRRLFLDYHGLRLIWSYMMDVATTETEQVQQFRLEVLKTLTTLPIPNKTMLMDSKVYSVVEKWAKQSFSSPSGESPEDEQTKVKEEVDSDSPNKSNDLTNVKDEKEGGNEQANNLKQEKEQVLITELATNLIADWSNLKEVFRIPKKERIEQMKEHEREADRGYKEELEKEQKRETYERYRSDRYNRSETDKRDRRRGRESPDFEYSRSKDKRLDERSNLIPVPRMTKYERRQLFALKVAKEEEEKQRRQQQELWKEHETRCLALGMDPHTTAALDPQTGYPLFFNSAVGQWQPYPIQDGSELQQQMTPVYVGGSQMTSTSHQNIVTPPLHVLQPGISVDISPSLQAAMYPINQTPTYSQQTTQFPPPLSIPPQQFQESPLQISNNLVQIHNGTSSIPVQGQSLFIEKSIENSFQVAHAVETPKPPSQPDIPPPLDLPPKWKWAKDERGRMYYYHVKERISQWLPPPPDHIGVQPDSSTSSDSSEESSSSNEEEDDVEEENKSSDRSTEDMEVDSVQDASIESKQSPSKKSEVNSVEVKKKRDGLVQERIISPRREDDRVYNKKYKEMKEKIRRQKERARLKDHIDKVRKHRRSNKSKTHTRHSIRLQTVADDPSLSAERKIKDAFRINMANVMVHFLNPYRKNDCKQGRITNTEDFKHLARKLTHFVLAKELKHCKSVDELQCNDNVKHKAKDFVRKYMSKFGAVYQKSTDDD
ncbi:histone-lysine N-methyltransferase SETD2 isoform X2 [Leptopilina boulardi]|uniref:histone-lysine N-methyltransferase SETD2 isoform X2 n=1 Tax=Leptopilina boulardi TaxID=63433 RepID=UPI0021F53144|nr:histone-lysine N-methyltransferase SETD2 isoform X2 [Leptopilina boulardi]